MFFNLFKKKPPAEEQVEPDQKVATGEGSLTAITYASFDPDKPSSASAAARDKPEAPKLTEAEVIAQWLTYLPEHVRPYRLTDTFPRLAVKIAEVWMRPDKLQKYLRELVLDDRGGRQGFPADVAGELFRLSSFVEDRIKPARGDGFGFAHKPREE